MFGSISNVLRVFARKVLAIDDTEFPEEQFELIYDLSKRTQIYDINAEDLNEMVKMLRDKHCVDSITVAKRNGSMLVSSNGSGTKIALSRTALFNYINSEIPKSEIVMVKSLHGWNMFIPVNDKMYIVNASSDLTQTELRVISQEVEEFLDKKIAGKEETEAGVPEASTGEGKAF